MLTIVDGDLFSSGAECLVNPVNTVGVMGAGLAKRFAERWPGLLTDYRDACADGRCAVGRVHLWRSEEGQWVANCPTKQDWRNPSQLRWVVAGMTDLASLVNRHQLASVAMPALGCGLGGLEWGQVRQAAESIFADTSVSVLLYRPSRVTR